MALSVAGGFVGNRRFRKAATGSRMPAIANTLKKKNNQRGHKVGKAAMNRYIKPAQPIKAKMIAAGSVERVDGDDIVFREIVKLLKFYHISSKLHTNISLSSSRTTHSNHNTVTASVYS
jgi:hypothetical protein